MNQRQAWLLLARLCDKAKRDHRGIYKFADNDLGLCTAMDSLTLPSRIEKAIQKKIDKQPAQDDAPFLFKWPWTKAGAVARAAFCRAQAKKLRKAKVKTNV